MYEFIESPARAEELSRQLMSEKVIGVDTETTGLDPHTNKVILLSITAQDKTYLIDTRKTGMEMFRSLLECETVHKLGVNNAFDYMMIKGTAGIDMESNLDLMLAEQCLMAGIQWSGFGFDAIAKKYLEVEVDKTLQTSFVNFEGEFSQEQLKYAALDTSLLPKMAEVIKKELVSAGVRKAWGIENRSLPAWADATFYGQKIDIPAWQEVMRFNYAKMEEAKGRLDRFFEPFFDCDLKGNPDVNYKSQPMLLYGLQKMGIKIDGELIKNTNKETQKKIRDLPVTQALEHYRQAVKAYGTYGQSYLDAIHPITGRIHPRFNQYGTDTGRPSCRGGLNVLNIPRDKKFRDAFTTDPDRRISTVDFSGAELRILADQSGDPLMVKGFNSGTDFHCYVASMLFGKEVTKKNENAKLRQPAKTINFMLAYGGGPGRLHMLLRAEGYDISFDECKQLFSKYKETFKTAIDWLDSMKQTAHKNLAMSNINGRRRRWLKPNLEKYRKELTAEALKEFKLQDVDAELESKINTDAWDKLNGAYSGIEREGANFMIQSTNAEWTKSSMYEIRKRCKKLGYDARMYNSVYDEIVLDVAAKDAEAVYDLQCKTMIACGQSFCAKVPVEVEGSLDTHWSK